jgi:putative protease
MSGGSLPGRTAQPSPARDPGLLEPSAIELLAPAGDRERGRAAILCGADAVYIGAERFGAREAAGNSLEDIAWLTAEAHQYWARVYVTLNTLLFDHELAAAERLAWQLHEIGVDGLIIQDAGLLECDLPPLPLIASTQMHNSTPGKVAFLEQVGFQRAILARELTLDEIRAIRHAVSRIELECFIHGALCVSYSGQCALSYATGGRSGNRGQCAQPCRKRYTLEDAGGRPLAERSHLLSLRDLNLSEHLPELLDAGVTSFKIEGRLKDLAYVANTVAHCRARLDAVLARKGLRRSSSGTSCPGFTPDPDKTFNRGYTTYFLHGRSDGLAFPPTPKMVGEEVGRVTQADARGITLATRLALHRGDGVCFFDARGELRGTLVNAVRGVTIAVQKPQGIRPGMTLYRNHDHVFLSQIAQARTERRIPVAFTLRSAPGGISLVARDADGVTAEFRLARRLEPAKNFAQALDTIRRQLGKTGNSIYACTEVGVEVSPTPFLAVSALNALRREALDALTAARAERRPRATGGAIRSATPYPEHELTSRENVLNKKAEAFYRRHGVTRIEPAAESGLDMHGRTVMITRYCLKHQLGLCPACGSREAPEEPLFLTDDEGNRLRLHFDCARCEMDLILE